MLAEADYDTTANAFNQQGTQNEGDGSLYVRFFVHPHPNEEETRKQGRPIFKEREYIEIVQPGNKENIVHRPVRMTDRDRFPKQYQAFKNKDVDFVDGTPLKSWPMMTVAILEELHYYNVRTIEQLAEISDANSQRFMGMAQWKQKAQAYLAATGKSKEAAELDTKLEGLQSENTALKEQLQAMATRMDELEAPKATKAPKADAKK